MEATAADQRQFLRASRVLTFGGVVSQYLGFRVDSIVLCHIRERAMDDVAAMEGFVRGSFTDGSKTRDTYTLGSGPGVVVIHEIPGITPQVAAFGRRVAARGMTAVLPVLFGTPGKPESAGYVAAQ